MSNKLRLSLDKDAYDLENMQSSDGLAYLKDPTSFHASRHLARNVNLTNINITRVKPRTDSTGTLFANHSQESPDSAQRFNFVTSPTQELPYKSACQSNKNTKTTKAPPTKSTKDVKRERFSSLEVEELSHEIAKTEGDLFTCPICYSDYEESSVIALPDCHHKFCKECITSYIKKQMSDFQVLKLQCPQDKCEENLQDAQLKIMLDAETYETYQAKKLLKLKNKDIYLRYCPKPGCTKPFYPDNKAQFTTCSCGTIICHGCFHPQHPGKTCVEATAGEFELFAENEDIKTCMICKTASEKRVGCAHVVCPVCDYEWCWNCGREWEPGHGSRCLNKWSPRAPKAFEKGTGRSCFEAFLNTLFLVFEIIFFGLSSALVVILIWPCMMSGEIEKNLLKKNIKSPGLRKVLGVILAVLSWPVAIIFYPLNAISEEYGGSCRRRRWKKGTSANFGFGNHLAEGRKKFSLSEKEEKPKSQPQQENKTEIGLKDENDKIEEIDLEALEGLERRKSDMVGVSLQKNRSRHTAMPMMVSNHMIPSQMDILNNLSPDSARNVPNLQSNDRRQ